MNEFIRKHRSINLFLLDILIIFLSCILSDLFVGENAFSKSNISIFLYSTLLNIAVYGLLFYIFKIYKYVVGYVSAKMHIKFFSVCLLSAVIVSTAGFFLPHYLFGIKQSILTAFFIVFLLTVSRLVKFAVFQKMPDKKLKDDVIRKKILVIGAGYCGNYVVNDLVQNMSNVYEIVGIIDDNKSKLGCSINGIRVIGGREKIIEICKKYDVDVIMFAISKISNAQKRDILNLCKLTGCAIRILPSISDIILNKTITDNFRNMNISDFLGRDTVKLDAEGISKYIKNKIVLVTGAGGSIGSELCRNIIKYAPGKLVLLDMYENSLYEIELELKKNYPDSNIEVIIASIRDVDRLDYIFNKYRPNIVFHAAAHKHVPMMEKCPSEAIKNNVFGTYNLVKFSNKYSVDKFIMISTDKAVNPTSIMGATKRVCEMMIQAADKESKTEFAAVRFGNVFGSNGSVVPIFQRQIESGGPVTVTDPEITRYFMTIPEAAQLVLQAGTYANGGEIFVLNMGEPVKIYDLAVNMIRLAGYEPNVDIKIEITGLRQGEKLYEELLMEDEELSSTLHDSIFVSKPMDISFDAIVQYLDMFQTALDSEDEQKIIETIKEIVPTYKAEVLNRTYENKDENIILKKKDKAAI